MAELRKNQQRIKRADIRELIMYDVQGWLCGCLARDSPYLLVVNIVIVNDVNIAPIVINMKVIVIIFARL